MNNQYENAKQHKDFEAVRVGIGRNTKTYDDDAKCVPVAPEKPLALKAQDLVYVANRSESKAEEIHRILFGVSGPQETNGKEACSVDDTLDQLAGTMGNTHYILERIVERLTGNC